MPVIIKRSAASTREVSVYFRQDIDGEDLCRFKAICVAPIKDHITTADIKIVRVTTYDGEPVEIQVPPDVEYDVVCTAWFILHGESCN